LGSAGVSRATTEAVVLSSIAVLFADYVISALLR
jgi:ABC-type transporter Mla maintaining outer membrane lipid asymmetry permease subunit MlaE